MPNSDIIEINNRLADNAKFLASKLSKPQTRKRGMIDMLGINCAISYLKSKKLRIDTRKSVYSIPILFEEFKITDIYYNNYRIDVITLYKEKTVKIPKVHVDVDILPDFYFIIQIGAKIKEAKIIGFIEAKSVLGCSCDSKFYYPTLDLIFDLRRFMKIARQSVPTRTILGKHADCLGLFLKFIDNDLSNVYKSQLIQHLMNCDSCRSRFIDTMEFENVASNIRYYPELMSKYENKIEPALSPVSDEHSNMLEEELNRIEKDDIEETNPVQEETKTEYGETEIAEPDAIKQDEPVSNKKVIDSIFREMHRIEVPHIKTIIKSKHRHKIIAFAVMFVIIIVFSFISISSIANLQKENKTIEQMQEGFDDVSEFEMLYGVDEDNPTHQARLIPKQRDINSFDIQQPVNSQPAYSPSVTNIAWEAPENLVKKQNYTNFLQLAGKNIKLNLQNDLLLVRDVPVNRLVKVNITVASSGEVQAIKLVQTSGSGVIDASVNKVIKDTLKYMKPPAHGIVGKPVDISLTIGLN